MVKTIALGADHGGFKLKEEIKKYLDKQKISYIDFGAYKFKKTDDYSDFAFKVGEYISKNDTKGILICKGGGGMCIAANKVKGVRAVNVFGVKLAKHTRSNDDANVLCLSAIEVKTPLAKRIVGAWLKEKFQGGRHARRVNKITKYEGK